MPKSCVYILAIGREHKKWSPGPYYVCVRPSQARNLFGTTRPPKKLGCGTFACTYAHPEPGKIVKITRDESDVAGLIKGQGLAVPKLYEAHKLRSPVEWARKRTPRTVPGDDGPVEQEWPDIPRAYALVLERLELLTGREKWVWQERLKELRRHQSVRAGAAETAPARPGAARRKLTGAQAAKAVCPHGDSDEALECEARMCELAKIATDLRSRGVAWSDMHAGNIGVDQHGRWKALDVGATDTPLDTDLPELHGRRR